LVGEGFEEPSPRCERFAAAIADDLRFRVETGERPKARLDPRCFMRVRDHVGYGAVELRRRRLVGVVLEDAGLCLDDLGQCPERHALPVREASALPPGDQLRVGIGEPRQLVDEPALADSGHADERDELRRAPAANTVERIPQKVDLAFPPDERPRLVIEDLGAEARTRLDRFPRRNRLGFPLRCDRSDLAVRDAAPRRAVRCLADHDAVHRCGGLKPGRGVHDIARRHSLTFRGARPEADKRLARRDTDP